MLVIPVYMLGQSSFQMACYSAANERLLALHKAPCEFSDATKVIESLRGEAKRYGETVFEKFEESTGIDQGRFARLASGTQAERDDLAHQILDYRQPGRTERTQLYPDKFSDGMATLTRHAQQQGFAGIVFMIDELILYLIGKAGRAYAEEFNNLVALADNSALDRAVPLWVIVAKQRFINETVPDDASQQHIREAMDHHKDRFPRTTELADTELVPIVEERILRVKPGCKAILQTALEQTVAGLDGEVRDTLLQNYTLQDLRRLYPFHPALVNTLVDISNRFSRERTSIRLLFELLIEQHPNLPIGALVPFASLFDIIFRAEGLTGGSRKEEMEAVRQTYYDRLVPVIAEAYPDANSPEAQKAHLLVKTILLASLSKAFGASITVEQILHLNYQDLRGRTTFGSFQTIANILTTLSNRSELVRFAPNGRNPAGGVAEITLAVGVQLADVLKRVNVSWRDQLDAFNELMRDLLNSPLQDGKVANFKHLWRGSERFAHIFFRNVAELTQSDIKPEGDEFTLFIDYPFDLNGTYTRADDLQVIERAKSRSQLAIGFWLPQDFSTDDSRDLKEYAQLIELERNPKQYLEELGKSQQEAVMAKIAGQKRTKADTLRRRLLVVYKEGDVRFLDAAITPVLDVDSLSNALTRIADTVCDRHYPHHPRFATTLNQRTLGRLLDEFLVPAAQSGKAVTRTTDLDSLLQRLGQPLELAEQGATSWTLRSQSRYLSKLHELATGKRIEADKIMRGLTDAFGFTRDLNETMILYLIKGQGYRAIRNDKPVADVAYGQLRGLLLEQGRRLETHLWVAAKTLIDRTWQVKPRVDELTVAAQDMLWQQLTSKARTVADELAAVRKQLTDALSLAGVSPGQSARMAVLEAAVDLNRVAANDNLDAYDGLVALLSWQPDGTETQHTVERQEAEVQIATREQMKQALTQLQPTIWDRISKLAESGNEGAQAELISMQNTLVVRQATADLSSHLLSWQKSANAIIDTALKTPSQPTSSRGTKTPIAIATGQDDNASSELDKKQLSAQLHRITLQIGSETIAVNTYYFEKALGEKLQSLIQSANQGRIHGTVDIHLTSNHATDE
jgi:hypothetical protein